MASIYTPDEWIEIFKAATTPEELMKLILNNIEGYGVEYATGGFIVEDDAANLSNAFTAALTAIGRIARQAGIDPEPKVETCIGSGAAVTGVTRHHSLRAQLANGGVTRGGPSSRSAKCSYHRGSAHD